MRRNATWLAYVAMVGTTIAIVWSLHRTSRFCHYTYATRGEPFYIHVPKTGGSSVEAWGRAYGYQWGEQHRPVHGACTAGDCNHWHLPMRNRTVQNASAYFVTLRDPIERAVSEAQYHGVPCVTGRLDAYVRKRLRRLSDPRGGPRSFETATTTYALDDCHWLPQVDYLLKTKNAVRFERIPNLTIVPTARLRVGMEALFGHAFDVHRNAHAPCNATLTPSTVDALRRFYARDVALLAGVWALLDGAPAHEALLDGCHAASDAIVVCPNATAWASEDMR